MTDYDELPKIISADYGIGIEFKNKSGLFISIGPVDGIRRVTLDISSWVGISFGAVHYYAILKTYSLSFKCLKSKDKSFVEVGKSYNICGAFEKPKCLDYIDVECKRPLTQKEKNDDPSRWSEYDKPGDMVRNFNTEEEAFQAGINTFKKRFSQKLGKNKEKWILYDDRDCTKPLL